MRLNRVACRKYLINHRDTTNYNYRSVFFKLSQAEEIDNDQSLDTTEQKGSALLGGMDIAVTDEINVPQSLLIR